MKRIRKISEIHPSFSQCFNDIPRLIFSSFSGSGNGCILDLLSPQLEDTGLKTTTFLQHFKDVVTTKFTGRDHHLPPLHPAHPAHPAHQQSALHHHHHQQQSFSTIFPTYLGMDRSSAVGGCGGEAVWEWAWSPARPRPWDRVA